ncbi:ATP-binding protein [Psychrobacter pulmonis]
MKFKTSSGIKSIVGKDLITDRYVAIFELVKNSYDARATEVIVSFNTSDDSENGIGSLDDGKIYIVDNGVGMSKDDLDNKWLKLAYSDKQEGSSEEDNSEDSLREVKNRVLVGSKGIGRFSSDSLGSVITIRTKVKYESIEHQLTVNWDDFDKDLKTLFEDVNVKYKENKQLSRNDVDSYTIIEISELRNTWTEEQLDGVTEKLRRLKNPFIENDDLSIYCGINIFSFKVEFNSNDKYLVYSNIADILEEKSINITAFINSSENNGKTYIVLRDRGSLVYEVERETQSILSKVDNIEISINYLTTSAKHNFTRRMGIQPVNYGNIFVYRNGFHVSPYGEEHYDIFGLNLRKNQGYNRYLATRELIGFISIRDSKNLFKETSSRNNGFIENGYFKTLEDFYMDFIQRPLERYVQLINWGEVKQSGKEVHLEDVEIKDNEKNNFKKYISRDNFKVLSFNSELDFEKNKPEKIIERIEEEIKKSGPVKDTKKLEDETKTLSKQFKELRKENIEKEKTVQKTAKEVETLKRQNHNLSLNRTEASYSAQITHHLTKLAGRLNNPIDKLNDLRANLNLTDEEVTQFNSVLRVIVRTKNELTALQEVLTKSDINTDEDVTINWFDLFAWYISEKEKENTNYLKATVNIFDDKFKTKWNISNTTVIDIVISIENFYQNALEHNANYLDVIFYENYITISSDSTLIEPQNRKRVFELGFTTKNNGTGIGLNQIKTFMNKHKMDIKVKDTEDNVQFIILKK